MSANPLSMAGIVFICSPWACGRPAPKRLPNMVSVAYLILVLAAILPRLATALPLKTDWQLPPPVGASHLNTDLYVLENSSSLTCLPGRDIVTTGTLLGVALSRSSSALEKMEAFEQLRLLCVAGAPFDANKLKPLLFTERWTNTYQEKYLEFCREVELLDLGMATQAALTIGSCPGGTDVFLVLAQSSILEERVVGLRGLVALCEESMQQGGHCSFPDSAFQSVIRETISLLIQHSNCDDPSAAILCAGLFIDPGNSPDIVRFQRPLLPVLEALLLCDDDELKILAIHALAPIRDYGIPGNDYRDRIEIIAKETNNPELKSIARDALRRIPIVLDLGDLKLE